MTKEALEYDCWVIGNIEAGMYLHWKGDGISGRFVDCTDPEDAVRYDTAEEARKAIQEDEDVQSEIANWTKPASPLHVKKGVIVSDEPEGPEFRDQTIRRARLLYCMDYIMHHLSDEEAIEPWLADGAPDGLYQTAPEPLAGDYRDLELGDTEFNEMVGLFIKTLAGEGRYRPNGLSCEETGKAVLS